MNRTLCLLPIVALQAMLLAPARDDAQRSKAPALVHFVMINLSGTLREATVRHEVVELPLAERVPMQAFAGDRVEITSSVDSKVDRAITISSADEGRVIAIGYRETRGEQELR